MKWRTLILVGLAESALLLLAVYFEPMYCVRGHVHGEAFFEGRSTSWWREELDNWVRHELTSTREGRRHIWFYQRRPSTFDWVKDRFPGHKPAPISLIWNLHELDRQGPSLLHGNPEAEPVLRELLDDPSPKIRNFARIGLHLELQD